MRPRHLFYHRSGSSMRLGCYVPVCYVPKNEMTIMPPRMAKGNWLERYLSQKLVLQFRGQASTSAYSTRNKSPKTEDATLSSSDWSTSSSWAYESDSLNKVGSLIVSHPIQDFAYDGLRQPYFCKSIIFAMEHDPLYFTKGLLLNRPTHRTVPNLVFGPHNQLGIVCRNGLCVK